jgi:hypothetical protein
LRCATIVLSPALLRCDDVTHAPFGGGLVASGCLRGLKHRINDAIVDLAFAPQLNAHRKRLNLPPAKRVYHKFFLSSEVVAAFPPWFATPSAQWPEAGETVFFDRFRFRFRSRARLRSSRRARDDRGRNARYFTVFMI